MFAIKEAIERMKKLVYRLLEERGIVVEESLTTDSITKTSTEQADPDLSDTMTENQPIRSKADDPDVKIISALPLRERLELLRERHIEVLKHNIRRRALDLLPQVTDRMLQGRLFEQAFGGGDDGEGRMGRMDPTVKECDAKRFRRGRSSTPSKYKGEVVCTKVEVLGFGPFARYLNHVQVSVYVWIAKKDGLIPVNLGGTSYNVPVRNCSNDAHPARSVRLCSCWKPFPPMP